MTKKIPSIREEGMNIWNQGAPSRYGLEAKNFYVIPHLAQSPQQIRMINLANPVIFQVHKPVIPPCFAVLFGKTWELIWQTVSNYCNLFPEYPKQRRGIMTIKELLLCCLAGFGLISSLGTIILLEMTSRKINREIDFNWIYETGHIGYYYGANESYL